MVARTADPASPPPHTLPRHLDSAQLGWGLRICILTGLFHVILRQLVPEPPHRDTFLTDHDASEEQSWRASDQQGNAPASEDTQQVCPQPLARTNHRATALQGGWRKIMFAHAREERARDSGEELECLPTLRGLKPTPCVVKP